MSKVRRSAEFKNNSRVIDMEEARAKRQARRQAQQDVIRKRQAQKRKPPETRGKRAIRRKRNRTRLVIVLIAMIVIGVLILMSMNMVTLMKEKNQVEAQHEALLKEKARLEQELANADNKEALEDVAREQLRLIKPGESLYMFPSDFGEDKTEETDND